MTVAELYLRTDNEQIAIAELDKVLYRGSFKAMPDRYLDKIVLKISVLYEKRLLIICI